MKRWIPLLLLVSILLTFCACGDSNGTEPTTTDTEVSEKTGETTAESTPEPTESPAHSDAATPIDGTYSLHTSESNGWDSWKEEDFSSVIITPVYAEYIVEGNEKYPAKFMMFDKPADTALYELKYDSVIYINRGKDIVYSYYAYDRASFELFLEDVEEEAIIDTGSDKSSMYWNADRESVYVMFDITDDFGGTAKLEFIISDNTGEISKEDMVELAKSELARIGSTMVILEPGQFWSVGKFSTIDLYDRYDVVQ